jgi:hypothetical protein
MVDVSEPTVRRCQADYNTVRLHAGIGSVTPTTSTPAAVKASAKSTVTGSPPPQSTDQLPSNPHQGTPMTTTRSWLGMSSPDWFINSDTPQLTIY